VMLRRCLKRSCGSASIHSCDARHNSPAIGYLTTPNRDDLDSLRYQVTRRSAVAKSIAHYLRAPKWSISLGKCPTLAIVAMPKTSVHENCSFKPGNENVGLPGEALVVNGIPDSGGIERHTNQHLNSGILGPNSSHHGAFCGGRFTTYRLRTLVCHNM
jgi:hypothetical protein